MSVLEAGQAFGRYTIINLETAVGPIESYRAYDSSISRDVRLSVLATRDRLVSDRFHAAMVALLDLTHPNILDIYDAGDIGGVLYLAMPLVDGITLAQRLSQGGLAPAEISKIVEQVGGALQYAHEHGIADGAVTLDNIFINTRGDALLSGFGAGALAGGDDQAAVRRRDLAMLGRVALALLAGHALMSEASESISALLQPYIARLPKSVQSVAADRYQKLVERATASDAAQRFASVADYLSAWRQAPGTDSGVQAPAAPATPAAAVPVPSMADQIQAQRRTDAAAQAQALQAGYNSQWLERLDAKKREAAEAEARIQRETKERSDTLDRARTEREARIGTGSTVAVPTVNALDPAKRAALARLMRTVEAVTEKRASTIGMRPLNVPAPASRPVAAPPKAPAPVSAPTRVAPAVTRAASAIPAAVAPRVAKQAAATALSAGSRVRPMLAGVMVFLFVVFCVFPLSCIIWASTLPDETPTPAATSTHSASSTVAAPTRVPTLAAATQTPRTLTATPLARSSAAPTTLPLDAVLVFTDTFQSGACRLPVGSSNKGVQACNDGRLYMLPAPAMPMWTVYDAMRGDMVFEADAQIITSTPSLDYGLIWAASADRFSGFSLTSDGALSMFDFQAGKFSYTIQGLSFSAVNPGVSGNRLRVRVSGGRFAFAINGREVPFTMSAAQSRGSIGYFVQSREPGAGVAFANAEVFDLRTPGTTAVPQPTSVPTR